MSDGFYLRRRRIREERNPSKAERREQRIKGRETVATELRLRAARLEGGIAQVAMEFGSFAQMGFFARLWWLLTGRFDEQLALRNALKAQEQAEPEQAEAA